MMLGMSLTSLNLNFLLFQRDIIKSTSSLIMKIKWDKVCVVAGDQFFYLFVWVFFFDAKPFLHFESSFFCVEYSWTFQSFHLTFVFPLSWFAMHVC